MQTRPAILLVCLLAHACCLGQSGPSSPSSKTHKKEKTPVTHVGTASFYANKFNGRKMANGDIFYQDNMTAACNIIPLNTYVRVTNLRNKRVVVVKITDRMHPRNPRLIDLSRSAAKKLGYTGHGLAKVKVVVLGKKAPPDWKENAALH